MDYKLSRPNYRTYLSLGLGLTHHLPKTETIYIYIHISNIPFSLHIPSVRYTN